MSHHDADDYAGLPATTDWRTAPTPQTQYPAEAAAPCPCGQPVDYNAAVFCPTCRARLCRACTTGSRDRHSCRPNPPLRSQATYM
jgi:hypothetical protein